MSGLLLIDHLTLRGCKWLSHWGLIPAALLALCLAADKGMAGDELSQERFIAACRKPDASTTQVLNCLECELKESETALQSVTLNTLETIPFIGSFSTSFHTEFVLLLFTAGKEFALFRDSQCAFNAALVEGTAPDAPAITRLGCMIELNYRRLRQLESNVDDIFESE